MIPAAGICNIHTDFSIQTFQSHLNIAISLSACIGISISYSLGNTSTKDHKQLSIQGIFVSPGVC